MAVAMRSLGSSSLTCGARLLGRWGGHHGSVGRVVKTLSGAERIREAASSRCWDGRKGAGSSVSLPHILLSQPHVLLPPRPLPLVHSQATVHSASSTVWLDCSGLRSKATLLSVSQCLVVYSSSTTRCSWVHPCPHFTCLSHQHKSRCMAQVIPAREIGSIYN